MKQLTLQQLIEHLKVEILSPIPGPDYPIFFVEKVELEIHVAISYDIDKGVKLNVLDVAGIEVVDGQTSEKSHTVTLTLTPILSRDEQRELIEHDKRLLAGIEEATQRSLRKLAPLNGEPE
jgi:hypothetical protein